MARPASIQQWPNRLQQVLRRFTRSRSKDEQLARWNAYDEQGAALERLMASDDWKVLEGRKEVYLRLRDLVLHTPRTSEEARRQAGIEWNTLDEWFRDLRQCVREGQKAREMLAKIQTTTPEKRL